MNIIIVYGIVFTVVNLYEYRSCLSVCAVVFAIYFSIWDSWVVKLGNNVETSRVRPATLQSL